MASDSKSESVRARKSPLEWRSYWSWSTSRNLPTGCRLNCPAANDSGWPWPGRRLHDDVHVTTVFVTHDQEEALDVADRLVVINQGRIEQVGPPDELYDHPTSEFVMSFLGPVTTLNGHLVRPHDLEIETHPFENACPGRIERFNRVGFEVRLDVRLTEDETASPVLATLTRAEATAKALDPGVPVWIRPVAGASQVRISAHVPTSAESLALSPADSVPQPTFT